MAKLQQRTALVALAGTGVLAVGTAAAAAPVTVLPALRPIAVSAQPGIRRAVFLAPHATLRIQVHAFGPAAIKPMPLPAKASPLTLVPVFVPRAIFAVPAPLRADTCSDGRSAVRWNVVPTTPFVPVDCLRDATLRTARAFLAPGGNKSALYGRAYSPRDLDAP